MTKVVLASSVSVSGMPKTRRHGIADEEDYPNPPFDPCSTTKMADELMGRYYRETYDLDLNTMKITTAWGPGRYWGYTGQFNDFIRKVAVGEDATFPDDFSYREEKPRWMYVKVVGYCFAHAAKAPKAKSYLFDLGSKSPFNAKDVIAALKKIVPERKMELKERDTPSKVSATVAGSNGLDVDCSRLHDELGFEPRFTFDSALRDRINF